MNNILKNMLQVFSPFCDVCVTRINAALDVLKEKEIIGVWVEKLKVNEV